jgi:spermidine/putrescine transport system substrate-binding protein
MNDWVTRRAFAEQALRAGLSLGLVNWLLSGCRAKEHAPPADEGSGAPLEKTLSLYIWSDYLADSTVPDFEKEFGVEVTVDNYESNEEMAAKLEAGASGYDLVVPSSYVLTVLRAAGLLAPVDRRLIPNATNIAPLFGNPAWDPGDQVSIPWQWGFTGIAYRKDRIPVPPDSWAIFLDPKYRGKMTMLDDGRDVLGAFLRYHGHSLNSVAPAELAEAKVDAIEAKKNLKAFLSAPVKGQLVAGDVWVAQLWNGDTAQAQAESDQIGFAAAKEGATIWLDALVIPKAAKHKRAAHAFMNYILRPQVGAAISDKTGYGTPNAAALPLTKAKLPYPSAAELAKLEYQIDLGQASDMWDRIWTEVKAA